MIQAVAAILPSIFKMGSKMIPDADKRMEFADKVSDRTFSLMEVMLQTKTYPFIDALVKLAYASEAIIKGLFRPVVATGLFVWGLFNPEDVMKLQQFGVIGEGAIGVVFGGLPAWGIDRGLDKRREKKKPAAFEDDDW